MYILSHIIDLSVNRGKLLFTLLYLNRAIMELKTHLYNYRLVYCFFPKPYHQKDEEGYFFVAGHKRGVLVECTGALYGSPWYFLPEEYLKWSERAV